MKNSRFFSENASFFAKKPNFWKFWEILLFRSHSTSNWLFSTVFKKFKFFFRKKRLLFWIAQCFNVLKNLLFRWHSTSNLLPSPFFENFKVFFGKPIFFFAKTQILNVLSELPISVAFCGKFFTFSRCWKDQLLFENNTFFWRSHTLNVLRSLIFSFAFYSKNAIFSFF